MKPNTSNNGQEEKVILTLTELNRTLTLARKQGYAECKADAEIIIENTKSLKKDCCIKVLEIAQQQIAKLEKK